MGEQRPVTEIEQAKKLIVIRPQAEPPQVAYSDLDYAITEETATSLLNATPENTQRAYAWAWKRFADWCAESGRVILPATAQTFTEYVQTLASAGLAPNTIEQAMGAIRTRHRRSGHPNEPDTTEAVRLLRAYRRDWSKGGNRVRKRTPILIGHLRLMVATCDPETPAGVRDRALLLLGFNMMARRSELAARDVNDVADAGAEGVRVLIGWSKTDQDGTGVWVPVPYGQHEATCAVRAVRAWTGMMAARGLTAGALFRPVDRHGRIGGEDGCAGQGAERLTGHGVNNIVNHRAILAGLSPSEDWGAHGLRAGAATAAYAAGVPVSSIARQGRWNEKSPVVLGYIRAVDEWRDHPMKGIGL